jgi:hypothetical protein
MHWRNSRGNFIRKLARQFIQETEAASLTEDEGWSEHCSEAFGYPALLFIFQPDVKVSMGEESWS